MTSKKEGIQKLAHICRICLKDDGPMSSIFTVNATGNDEQTILANRITSIAEVQVQLGDGLPVSICQSCCQRVNKFYDFRRLVEASDRSLRSYLEKAMKTRTISMRAMDDACDLDYQEFLVETDPLEDTNDLCAVKTLIVPPASKTQTWRICSIEERDDSDETVPEMMGKKIFPSPRSMEIDSVDKANDQIVEKLHSQEVQPVAMMKNMQCEPSMFEPIFTKDKDLERVLNGSENLPNLMTIVADETNEVHETLSSSQEKYRCQLCLKSFKSLRNLKSHVKDHFLGGKERIQICEVDREKDPLTNQLDDSNGQFVEVDQSSEREILPVPICSRCDRLFDSLEDLLCAKEETAEAKKSRVCEGEETWDEMNQGCEECGSPIEVKNNSNRDQAIHEDSSLTCQTCNKHFRNAQSHKMHLKRHTLGTRFNCLNCGKSYYSNSELARHAQLHTGTREYPCHLCEMSFFSRPELNRHIKYHKGEKKFECKICSKTYYESGHLRVHERAHTGEKPFACTICNKAFVTKSKMIRHLKTHEKDRTAGETNDW